MTWPLKIWRRVLAIVFMPDYVMGAGQYAANTYVDIRR